MHSDDLFASTAVLESIVGGFEERDADGVYGDLEYVSAEDSNRVIRYWSAGSYDREKLKSGWMPPHPTLYLRREVFEKYGVYDTSYRVAADYDAMLRWLLQGNIRLAYVPRVFVRMRVGGASNQSLKQIARKSFEDYRALRKNGAGGLRTLLLKNLRKVGQFFVRS
jgi:glycosyltransferase